MITRRKFLKNTAAATAVGLVSNWAAASNESDRLGAVLPMRRLIRNGEKVTAFCLGGYHLGVVEEPKEAEAIVEKSMEMGVRFYDNARRYWDGRAEDYYGRFLTPKYRDDIFLMTKSPGKTAEEAKKELEDSLRAMRTDQVDLWQIHGLNTIEDVDRRLNNGVLEVFLEAKQSGKARYIGFTGHRNPKVHMYFLDFLKKRGLELDTCQLPLNVCDPSWESFEVEALPELLKREYGVIAMKTMAGGSMMGLRIDTTPKELKTVDIPNVLKDSGLTYAELHQYVYSLPVSSLCSGCITLEQVKHNVNVLKRFKGLSESEKKRLVSLAKPYAGFNVENYKRVLS
ncbi:MAG: aldo/keto reductase [Puniceicoccaceae bacterium]